MTALHWFRHDLRVNDNPALKLAATSAQQLLCVFVVEPAWFVADQHQCKPMGHHRWQFLQQSLMELDSSLRKMGNSLTVVYGNSTASIAKLIDQHQVSTVTTTPHHGLNETHSWHRLQEARKGVRYAERGACTLFASEQLPFELDSLPSSFSKFRKIAEKLEVDPPQVAIDLLPPQPPSLIESHPLEGSASVVDYFCGGEQSGLEQLNFFLHTTHAIDTYKLTRNGLDGREYSSKLSPWLSNGCMSPRTAWHSISRYEQKWVENESTYWMKFELLWREYFHWYAKRHGKQLFAFAGIKSSAPNTSFFPERFARWCNGTTPFPIVNACMKQLNETGYMSNRGRQLVASCFVHELQLDWRFGAAYFEQQLIDYDVASNWGNWQYLAGVGADPRAHRQFDLAKQTKIYDPEHRFINRWQGEQDSHIALDSMDIVDWPITAP